MRYIISITMKSNKVLDLCYIAVSSAGETQATNEITEFEFNELLHLGIFQFLNK